ncbi:MAG TPA: HAD family hydrolase [Ruminococcus sp.]|nr:HAD family hydrolase [Ruminococcus sp.]
MIKGVIFDMDGLMIDTEKLLMRFWIQSADEYGFDMKKEHVLSIRSLAPEYAVEKLKGFLGDDFDYYKVKKRRIELMNDYISKNGIEKKYGLDELLEYLDKHGIKKAVATATDIKRTEKYLTQLQIIGYFDKIVSASMVEHGKPAPDIYLRAASEINLDPKECMALEDSPNGICSAYRAGCNPVMVPDLSQPDEETEKMLFAKADNLLQVINILQKLIEN